VHWLWLKGGRVRRFVRSRRLASILDEARSLGWCVVWTAHNIVPHDDTAEDQWLAEKLARVADGVIVHTDAAREMLRTTLDVDCPVRVIPHGHYRDAYPPPIDRDAARRQLGLNGDRHVLLAFGQVRPYKGFQDLIERFRQSDLDATLIVAGDPTNRHAAATLRSRTAEDPRIRLDLRFHDPEETSLLFSAADRVVLPYRRVTTSGTLVLALSLGRACVIPDDATLLDISGEAAVERFASLDDLIPAIKRSLASDPTPQERAAYARAGQLTWAPIGEQTLDFFRQLTTPDAVAQ
jgi:glycosyltransferase involved in cell wall biosynthesis